jgi:hypothetical protein
VKLYVCYTTIDHPHVPGFGKHACSTAYKALRSGGHDPEVVRSYGFGALPDALQPAPRKLVKEKTGSSWVPALETDDGEWISGSREIADWAQKHPAGA